MTRVASCKSLICTDAIDPVEPLEGDELGVAAAAADAGVAVGVAAAATAGVVAGVVTGVVTGVTAGEVDAAGETEFDPGALRP
ncbi:MAG: hypothetical protein C5B49_16440 [Bdellovibrio sp.]|nr:MAG: hypothetical protein C5B49_16440 [Bdellovibrio sp.]